MADTPLKAFPYKGEFYKTPGMDLRDWFAGQALSGMLGDPERDDTPGGHARVAYAIADAMMEARKNNCK